MSLMDTTADGALEVAERIRAAVAGLDLGGPERGLTVSVGFATFPDDAALMEELVDKADWTLYLATRQGRDRVLPFGPNAHAQTGAHPSGRPTVLPGWLDSPHSLPSPGQRKESA